MTRHIGLRPVLLVAGSLVLLAVACQSEADPGGSFLAEGDQAPGFTLPSATGEQVALSDFTSRKPVLLYFSMGPG